MDEKRNMLLDWMRKIHQLEYAHCFQSLWYNRLERRIGIWAFILPTIVAFTYRFPFIQDPAVKDYILPSVLFVVALLTGFQTFLKPGEKAETHRKLGLEYEKLRHEIEIILTITKESEIDDATKDVKAKWDSMSTIYVNEKYFTSAKDKVKKFNKYPEELGFLPNVR